MKKRVCEILLGLVLIICTVGFVACGRYSGSTSPNGDNSDDNNTHFHEFTSSVVNPTCTEKGYTVYTCACGDSYNDNYTNKLGHRFSSYLYDNNATYEKDGTETATCNRQGCNEKDIRPMPNTKKDVLELLELEEYDDGYTIVNCTCQNIEPIKMLTLPSEYKGKPVTSIGDYAFDYCTSLRSITIPKSVKIIGKDVFNDSLESIIVDGNNNYFSSQDGILYDKGKTQFIYVPKSISGDIIIPNSVTSIGDSTFYDCNNLQSITIPNSVTSIGAGAFDYCDNLQYNEYDNGLYLGNNENKYLVLVKAKYANITSCQINTNTKFIYDEAFFGCRLLKKLTIPSNVKTLGFWVFGVCSSLENINIEEGLLDLGVKTFSGCDKLNSIIIPKSVSKIGSWAFDCAKLETVTFEDTTTWYYTSTQNNYTGGTQIDVTSPSQNATNLRNYLSMDWYKK